MKFLQSIQNFYQKFYPPKYAGMDLNEWHYNFRTVKNIDLPKIFQAIQDVEQITIQDSNQLFDLITIHQRSKKVISICLCCYAFSKFKNPPPSAISKMIADLSHPNEKVRRFSAIALTEISTLDTLIPVVNSNTHSKGVRTLATSKLMEFGAQAEMAIPALFNLIEDSQINYRSHFMAAEVLANIGEAAKESLIANLNHKNENLKYYSAHALSILKPQPYLNSTIKKILEEK